MQISSTSNELGILIIGWLLGILSIIIGPFIIAPIKNWQGKRIFKKILKADIEQKRLQLNSIEQRIITFYGTENLDLAIFMLKTRPENVPLIQDKISEDFYKTNYEKILQYFNEQTELLRFYENIKSMNALIDVLEKAPPYKHNFVLSYYELLKYCLYENISIN